MRTITLGTGQTVTLKEYVRGVKFAKAHPHTEFKSGLTCWWPCKGQEILEQFFEGVQDRINQAIPYIRRGC